MEKIKKYYPFWLGLIVCIGLIGIYKEVLSLAVLWAYVIGYFRLFDFNK